MADCMDRLSGLPDDVICHVLSFIPTKCSVRTSIFAKRWRFLWARVPCLEFNGRVPAHIINHALLHHMSNIKTFRLLYADYNSNDTEFESWIATLIARNVRNLSLDLLRKLRLPECLFTCNTLVDLSLGTCCDIPTIGSVCFPALKRLHLKRGVKYESDESLPRLLSGCPVLEELSVHATKRAYWCLSLPRLTRLELDLKDNRAYSYYNEEKGFDVKLDTPALRYINLGLDMSTDISLGKLDYLIEADVGFYLKGSPVEEKILYPNYVIGFLRMLSHVKCLTLTTCYWQGRPDSWFPDLGFKFHNLTQLNVDRGDWPVIVSLVESAVHLRVLTISALAVCSENLMKPERVPPCLISHLERVNLFRFSWDAPMEFDLVEYILGNARVLKRMKIHVRYCSHDIERVTARITSFERCSEKCEFDWTGLAFRLRD